MCDLSGRVKHLSIYLSQERAERGSEMRVVICRFFVKSVQDGDTDGLLSDTVTSSPSVEP
jgi:hypothetical protein